MLLLELNDPSLPSFPVPYLSRLRLGWRRLGWRRPPEALQYLGVSFGITLKLYNFWHKSGYRPLYLRQTANETTGEHTCIMLQPLQSKEVEGTECV